MNDIVPEKLAELSMPRLELNEDLQDVIDKFNSYTLTGQDSCINIEVNECGISKKYSEDSDFENALHSKNSSFDNKTTNKALDLLIINLIKKQDEVNILDRVKILLFDTSIILRLKVINYPQFKNCGKSENEICFDSNCTMINQKIADGQKDFIKRVINTFTIWKNDYIDRIEQFSNDNIDNINTLQVKLLKKKINKLEEEKRILLNNNDSVNTVIETLKTLNRGIDYWNSLLLLCMTYLVGTNIWDRFFVEASDE